MLSYIKWELKVSDLAIGVFDIDKDILENIDIDMGISENIDIDIDIDKGILRKKSIFFSRK